MSTPTEVVAEHAALVKERAELQKLCMDEWKTMTHQVAKQRQDRLWAIRDRLTAIEKTATWRGRTT